MSRRAPVEDNAELVMWCVSLCGDENIQLDDREEPPIKMVLRSDPQDPLLGVRVEWNGYSSHVFCRAVSEDMAEKKAKIMVSMYMNIIKLGYMA